ncbi:hypothetical protein WICPIJ_009939 [Wickerhamomyces pijperi]|uniref:Uncharacterized protein n=1 Tax=Wickerhamomyces pijperi TaxID=599730 RepID=A0A9P8PK14_WICPI|nr:hypothetical protein WICPIJ_009939 [Wickerhamomyces pijperi]
MKQHHYKNHDDWKLLLASQICPRKDKPLQPSRMVEDPATFDLSDTVQGGDVWGGEQPNENGTTNTTDTVHHKGVSGVIDPGPSWEIVTKTTHNGCDGGPDNDGPRSQEPTRWGDKHQPDNQPLGGGFYRPFLRHEVVQDGECGQPERSSQLRVGQDV